jgi:hypothetical protein
MTESLPYWHTRTIAEAETDVARQSGRMPGQSLNVDRKHECREKSCPPSAGIGHHPLERRVRVP